MEQLPVDIANPDAQVLQTVFVEAHWRQFETDETQFDKTHWLLTRLYPETQVRQMLGEEHVLQLFRILLHKKQEPELSRK